MYDHPVLTYSTGTWWFAGYFFSRYMVVCHPPFRYLVTKQITRKIQSMIMAIHTPMAHMPSHFPRIILNPIRNTNMEKIEIIIG